MTPDAIQYQTQKTTRAGQSHQEQEVHQALILNMEIPAKQETQSPH